MLRGGERHVPLGPRPINHPDVLVRVGDAVDVQKRGAINARVPGDSSADVRREFHVKAAFLRGLPAAPPFPGPHPIPCGRPAAAICSIPMMDQQNFRVVNDKDNHGKIDFFVEVRHGILD